MIPFLWVALGSVLGLVMGLSIAWHRVQFWRQRADHWLMRANRYAAQGEAVEFSRNRWRTIALNRVSYDGQPVSWCTTAELIAPSTFGTEEDQNG